jgi:hypothetical protein
MEVAVAIHANKNRISALRVKRQSESIILGTGLATPESEASLRARAGEPVADVEASIVDRISEQAASRWQREMAS